MRENALFHARHEDRVELKAFGGMHRHERDRLPLFGDRVQIRAQAHPLQEVRKGIPMQLAHRFRLRARIRCRRRIERILRFVRL